MGVDWEPIIGNQYYETAPLDGVVFLQTTFLNTK